MSSQISTFYFLQPDNTMAAQADSDDDSEDDDESDEVNCIVQISQKFTI